MVNLGNAGDSSTMVKAFCDLQTYGFCVVRQGHRDGLPVDKPPLWIFCPLLKKKFPKDRILVEDCKKCKHHKGFSQPIENINRAKPKEEVSSFHVKVSSSKKQTPKKDYTEVLREATENKEEQDRIWKEEESKLSQEETKKEVIELRVEKKKGEKEKKVEDIGNLGELGNLKLFGFDINELMKGVSGHTLEEFAKNPDLAKELKEKLQKANPNTVSSEKKIGNVTVSYKVTKKEIAPKGTGEKAGVKPTKIVSEKDIEAKKEADRKWKEEEEKLFKEK